jgi:hypothetical protein
MRNQLTRLLGGIRRYELDKPSLRTLMKLWGLDHLETSWAQWPKLL